MNTKALKVIGGIIFGTIVFVAAFSGCGTSSVEDDILDDFIKARNDRVTFSFHKLDKMNKLDNQINKSFREGTSINKDKASRLKKLFETNRKMAHNQYHGKIQLEDGEISRLSYKKNTTSGEEEKILEKIITQARNANDNAVDFYNAYYDYLTQKIYYIEAVMNYKNGKTTVEYANKTVNKSNKALDKVKKTESKMQASDKRVKDLISEFDGLAHSNNY